MSDLEPRTVSALDQFSGICNQIADITVAHHQRLVDGKIATPVASELTADLHTSLLEFFIPTPVHTRDAAADD